jgi:hypothetical protein
MSRPHKAKGNPNALSAEQPQPAKGLSQAKEVSQAKEGVSQACGVSWAKEVSQAKWSTPRPQGRKCKGWQVRPQTGKLPHPHTPTHTQTPSARPNTQGSAKRGDQAKGGEPGQGRGEPGMRGELGQRSEPGQVEHPRLRVHVQGRKRKGWQVRPQMQAPHTNTQCKARQPRKCQPSQGPKCSR